MRISAKSQKILERLPKWAAPRVLTGILIGVMACGGSDSSQVPGVRSIASDARHKNNKASSISGSSIPRCAQHHQHYTAYADHGPQGQHPA